MWGSKTLGRGLGMALATSIFYSQGVNFGYFVLVLMMSTTFLFPLFSREMSHKAGFEFESYKSEIIQRENFQINWLKVQRELSLSIKRARNLALI